MGDPATQPERVAYRINEVAKMLGLSVMTVRRLYREQAIETFRVGRLSLATPEAIQAFIDRQTGR